MVHNCLISTYILSEVLLTSMPSSLLASSGTSLYTTLMCSSLFTFCPLSERRHLLPSFFESQTFTFQLNYSIEKDHFLSVYRMSFLIKTQMWWSLFTCDIYRSKLEYLWQLTVQRRRRLCCQIWQVEWNRS